MINTHINTGSALDLQLREIAFLIYTEQGNGSERKSFLEVRPILNGPDGPEYGAGFPADSAYIQRLLQRDSPPKLTMLDRRLIAAADEEAAWWAPPARQTLFFTGGRMNKHSGRTVSMPALLYHVRDRVLRVRALACRGRPTSRTPLYVAPLWNIYEHGTLCMGSMPAPQGPPADRIDAWERAFWDSAFTTSHDPRACGHPKGYSRMLTELRKLPRFPSRWLVSSKERLEQWLNSK